MATYTDEKLNNIIESFNGIGEALGKLEKALAAVDTDEYKQAGQDFIRDMAWCHRRMKESHAIYSADVAEAEAMMESDWAGMADEDGILRGAE